MTYKPTRNTAVFIGTGPNSALAGFTPAKFLRQREAAARAGMPRDYLETTAMALVRVSELLAVTRARPFVTDTEGNKLPLRKEFGYILRDETVREALGKL